MLSFHSSQQRKLSDFLQPEPTSNESGELDSVLERKFAIKDEESAKAVVNMMRSNLNDLSEECKLLIIATFRNASIQNKDLRKEFLEEGSAEAMLGARIMDRWMYEASKTLEHLATHDNDDKRWYHATTASFTVMECLKFIWDCLITDKKEHLLDKKVLLNTLHDEHGLEWNQREYLNDVSKQLDDSTTGQGSQANIRFLLLLP